MGKTNSMVEMAEKYYAEHSPVADVRVLQLLINFALSLQPLDDETGLKDAMVERARERFGYHTSEPVTIKSIADFAATNQVALYAKIIREACIVCNGTGYSHHMPANPTDLDQEPAECEFCGRPIDALYKSLQANRRQGSLNGGWVAVSERNPDSNGVYLVTMKSGTVTKLAFNAQWITWGEKQNVIAWMPLPAPFTPPVDGKEEK